MGLADLLQKFTEWAVEYGDSYDETATETATLPRPASLSVEATNGRVSIRGEQRSDVAVEVTKHAKRRSDLEKVGLAAKGGDGDPLTLRATYDGVDGGDVRVDFDVAIPADVSVDGVETKSGTIEVTDATGDATLQTAAGSITAERVDGFLDLRTEAGTITARDVTGIDRARSATGKVDVDLNAVRQDATVESEVGKVAITAGPDLDADVRLTSDLGSVDAPTLGLEGGSLTGGSVEGRLGAGTHDLSVSTSVGAIEFEPSDLAAIDVEVVDPADQ
jgi:hypothetical protein